VPLLLRQRQRGGAGITSMPLSRRRQPADRSRSVNADGTLRWRDHLGYGFTVILSANELILHITKLTFLACQGVVVFGHSGGTETAMACL